MSAKSRETMCLLSICRHMPQDMQAVHSTKAVYKKQQTLMQKEIYEIINPFHCLMKT